MMLSIPSRRTPGALAWAVVLFLASGCATVSSTGGRNTAERATLVTPELVSLKVIEVNRASDPAELTPYIQSEDAKVRAAAALALGRLQAPGGASLATAMGEDADKAVRKAAYFALGQIPGEASEGALMAFIKQEGDAELRAEAVRSLGRVGGEGALSQLLASMADDSAVVRAAAANAVGVHAYRNREGPGLDAEGAQALITALSDESAAVRRGAAYALVRATVPAASAPQVVDALEGLFSDEDEHVRLTAARAVGSHGTEQDGTRVAPLLADESWQVRVNALRAVGKLGGPTAAWVIRPALDDAHPLVREQAIDALGRLGDAQAAEWIEPMMADGQVGIATAALKAFAQLQGPAALPTLEAALEDTSPWARSAAADALGDVNSQVAVDTLIRQADQELDPRVMLSVADALGRPDVLRPEAVSGLLRLLERGDSAVTVVVAAVLSERGIGEAILDLISAYERLRPGRDYEAQVAIINALATLDAPAILARELLEGAAQDPESRVAIAAADALNTLYDANVDVSDQLLPTPVSASSLTEANRRKDVWIETPKGTIHLELYPDAAPLTVANFTRLAGNGYYDGLLWHRVVPSFVVQTGSPRGDGWGGPGYEIPDELNPIRYEPGTLGMALSGPDTGGSQVFITHGYEPHLDGTYTVFGRVVDGMDVVESLVRNTPITRIRFSSEAQDAPNERTLEAF